MKRNGRATLAWLGLISGLWVVATQLAACTAPQDEPAAEAAGYPQFQRAQLLEKSSETSANVSIADFNGDGHPDIVLAKGRHWPLLNRVLFNDGRGGFAAAQDLGDTADRSYSVSVADLDADGDIDVVVSNDAPDPKRVYTNDGAGNFTMWSTYGRPEWPTRNARVADLNGDGLPDIIAANRTGNSDGSNFVCLNRGQGRFDADCIAFSHESATTIAAADVNGDGSIDLIVPHREGGQSYVYLNSGKADFPERIPFGTPDAAIRIAEAADFNGDGRPDIVLIDERRGAAVCFQQEGGTFSEPSPVTNTRSRPYALTVGDLNANGSIDIVVGHVEAPSTVYFNAGSGRTFLPVQFGDTEGAAYGFAIGDLDHDGHADIAVARSDAPNVVYFGGPAAVKAANAP